MSVEALPSLTKLTNEEVKQLLSKYSLGLAIEEARKIEQEILKRPMTVAEATAWSIQGSEHCSYKSSRAHLSLLPTQGRHVILGPGEDSGIIAIAEHNGERYGIVMAHESHNHPSQVVPYEGAATGIGGIVRDVVCMGAKVIATADPLRFGEIREHHSRWVATGVRAGIGGYGNPIGVPNLAGDVYWSNQFNDNCLVNVVALGVVKESDVIHSRAPQSAAENRYEYILVGKPTDNSGFGGATLASDTLLEEEREHNKGAVQEPNAFLKRHLLESTYELFKILKGLKCHSGPWSPQAIGDRISQDPIAPTRSGLQGDNMLSRVGFKDLGAGGILCASAEMADAAGVGAEINVDDIPVSMHNLPPEVILCAETQERLMWIVPPDLSPLILAHYNERWALPKVSVGARAAVIGKVTRGNYMATNKGERVVDARAQDLCRGLKYNRPYTPRTNTRKEPLLEEPVDYGALFKRMLAHENIASRASFYERYDKNVQGQTIIEAGRADAGVLAPFLNEDIPTRHSGTNEVSDRISQDPIAPTKSGLQGDIRRVGIALSVDGNPYYARISPYWGAANAVAEAMRNVAAVGATPWALTDCLNYGNPEKEEQMWEFVEGVKGIADAAGHIHLKGHPDETVPIISGNVSFYNESPNGTIDPSAIIACLGRLEDYSKAITTEFKESDSEIYLLGERKDELGGSVYYHMMSNAPPPPLKVRGGDEGGVMNDLGANVPQPNFDEVERQIYAITDMIDAGLLLSCHDISDGGLAVTLAEMCFGGDGENRIGVNVDITHCHSGANEVSDRISQDPIPYRPSGSRVQGDSVTLPSWKKLFSETGGFVFETKHAATVKEICSKYNLQPIELGKTSTAPTFIITDEGKEIINETVEMLADRWLNGLREELE